MGVSKSTEERVSAQESEKSKAAWNRAVISPLSGKRLGMRLSNAGVRGDFAVLYTDVTMAVYVCQQGLCHGAERKKLGITDGYRQGESGQGVGLTILGHEDLFSTIFKKQIRMLKLASGGPDLF